LVIEQLVAPLAMLMPSRRSSLHTIRDLSGEAMVIALAPLLK
jgi:hypothetical protein